MSTARSARSLSGVIAITAILILWGLPAQAIGLDQAKQQGMVCELSTGYLQATASATRDARALVDRINAKRQAEYRRIANEHGITTEQVGRMTAEKLSPKCR